MLTIMFSLFVIFLTPGPKTTRILLFFLGIPYILIIFILFRCFILLVLHGLAHVSVLGNESECDHFTLNLFFQFKLAWMAVRSGDDHPRSWGLPLFDNHPT